MVLSLLAMNATAVVNIDGDVRKCVARPCYHEAMLVQRTASRWRVVPVVLGSAVTFIVLGFFEYWLYFTNFTDGTPSSQVLFYFAFMVHLLGSFGAAAALTIWTRAPIYPATAAVVVTFAILMVPLVGYTLAVNDCHDFISFPVPRECHG